MDHVQKTLPSLLCKVGMGLLGVGIIVAIITFVTDATRGYGNYLVLYMFLVSIGVGSLFLVALEYVAGAVWSTPFRRISEILSSRLPYLIVLALPLIWGMHDIYHWTHSDAVMADHVLAGKSGYLNITFFLVRFAVCFGIWILFDYWIVGNSKRQDQTGDSRLTDKNIKLSAVFMPIFAITLTVSAVDWMMSLSPHWYSTMFGVYYFSGTLIAAIAVLTIFAVPLREKGYLNARISKDHYYNLGALLFAFNCFWAYITFCQFMLIWYGNLPEETSWFVVRTQNGWQYIAVLLAVVHFIIPFFALLSRSAKMRPRWLVGMAVWMLMAHLLDLYFIIVPGVFQKVPIFGWMEIGFIAGMVGLVMIGFYFGAKRANLTPVGDPKLARGLAFHL